MAQDGLAGLGSMQGTLVDIVAHRVVQTGIAGANLAVFGAEDSPGSYRELHHGHEGVYLAGAHDELFVEFAGVDVEERGELSATNHVGAGIGIAQHAANSHVGDEHRYGVPRVVLVANTLHEGQSAGFPGGTEFVERVGEAQFGPALREYVLVGILVVVVILAVGQDGDVAGIEFEPVDTIFLHALVEGLFQRFNSLGVGHVVAGAIPVPPVDHGGRTVFVFQQVAFGVEVAELRRVGRNKRRYPQHHLKAETVQLVGHGPGIGEFLGLELEVAIVALPVVVDHEDAFGESIVDDVVGILQNVFLILVIHELDPGIVLRFFEEELGRGCTLSREVVLAGVQVGIAQGFTGLGYLGFLVVRLDEKRIVVQSEPKGLVAPHITSLRRQQQGRDFVVEVDL